MTYFVLVPGAWLGAWAWNEVSPHLNAAGYDVTAATLSGLAERQDLPLDHIGQDTHVDDIVAIVEQAGLRDVVLVGHSYSGIPVGQAAARLRDRVSRVVYVDANIPHDGQSFIGAWSERGQEMVKQQSGQWGLLAAARGIRLRWAGSVRRRHLSRSLLPKVGASSRSRSRPVTRRRWPWRRTGM